MLSSHHKKNNPGLDDEQSPKKVLPISRPPFSIYLPEKEGPLPLNFEKMVMGKR
jgi:hypothetical protein